MSKVRAVSIFSGAGGFDIGLEKTDAKTVLCIDRDDKAAKTLKKNSTRYGDRKGNFSWKVTQKDVREVNFVEEVEKAGSSKENIDLLIGGSPCQPFSKSNSGSRKGSTSRKGELFKEFGRALDELDPEGFIFENVRGIKTTNDGEDFEKIIEEFSEKRDYKISEKTVNAANFGVPQKRKRLIIIGKKESEPGIPEPEVSKENWVSSGEALSDVEKPDQEDLQIGGNYGHLLEKIPPGANYQHLSERKYCTEKEKYIERDEDELDEKVFDWRSRHWNYLLKLDPDSPSWTIQAQPGKYTGPFHWESRELSIPETKKLMDFPLDYRLAGQKRSTHQWLLGNAVPPGLSESMVSHLISQISNQVE